MPKYLIRYDYGYGDEIEVIDATGQASADDAAYAAWLKGAKGQALYSADLLTPEIAQWFELDMEDYE